MKYDETAKLTPVTILSACLAGADAHANYTRTSELRAALCDYGFSFTGISTVENGKTLQSFMVEGEYSGELLALAEKFGQSSVIHSDNERFTYRFTNESDYAQAFKKLGKLYRSCKDDAMGRNLYLTFIEEGKEHYFVLGEK